MTVKEKWNRLLPVIFLLLVALSRWPGLFPPSFSAVYALVFCAGVYFRGRIGWWLPLVTLMATDIALNVYYQHKYPEGDVWSASNLANLGFNYVAYLAVIAFGRRFKPQSSFMALVGGGILGAILFYFITNTASWFFNPFHNPQYTKTFSGWLLALIKGIDNWPQTWEFFRNTLSSAALFMTLFVASMKMTVSAVSPA
ncbi:MAG TPA: DUF6580 family putative transport protein, partial [Verrucomicrobiae bacterium]|nr:DUF6580 family putative transport protein [Verrucomicrobiae bacterium]